jgi:hypothetical protein
MAGGAAREDDRRDVAREGRRITGDGRRRGEECDRDAEHERSS